VHAVVARSTFPSQNLQNTPSALLEVDMLKKFMPLWREAHFQVKSAQKTDGYGALLDVQMSFQAQGIVHLVKNDQNVRVL